METNAQGELFPVWRHHAVFTDSPRPMLDAEADHRRHAIIEQVIADLKNGPLAHLPSVNFAANSAWLVLAAMAFNLTRATGVLADQFHAKAVTATIRAHLINVAARVTRSARRATLRLPTRLALGHRLATAVHRGDRPTSSDLTPTTSPNGPESETEMDAPGPAGQHNAAHTQVDPDQDQLHAPTKSDGASGLNLPLSRGIDTGS